MTSTRSSKWVLFSALQREGRRMSVWLALFPFLGFLYALCHGLLQALMNRIPTLSPHRIRRCVFLAV